MSVTKPHLSPRWWKDAKPEGVKGKKLDEALVGYERARTKCDEQPGAQSAVGLETAVRSLRRAVAEVTKECDKREHGDVLRSLKELLKLAERELKELEREAEDEDEDGEGGVDVDKLRQLLKKLDERPMPFAFGMLSATESWFVVHRTKKGNSLMGQLKKDTGCKTATFGTATARGKTLVLAVEGPNVSNLDKRVRLFLKANMPMPFKDVELAAPEDRDDDVTGGGLEEEELPVGASPEEEEMPVGSRTRPAAKLALKGTVGQGGKNARDDATAAQEALNRNGASLTVDGLVGPQTIAAIKKFQKSAGFQWPDGRIDPGGKTEAALNGAKPGDTPYGKGGGGAQPYGGGKGGGGGGGAPPYGGGKGGGGGGAPPYGGGKGGGGYPTHETPGYGGGGHEVEGGDGGYGHSPSADDDAIAYAKKVAKAVAKERDKVKAKVDKTVSDLYEAERKARDHAQNEAEAAARKMREAVERAYAEGERLVRDTADRVKEVTGKVDEATRKALDEATRLAGKGLKSAGEAAEKGADWARDAWNDLTE